MLWVTPGAKVKKNIGTEEDSHDGHKRDPVAVKAFKMGKLKEIKLLSFPAGMR